MAVTGLLGSSILTVINCGSTQWNLKKPPIILSNSGHVPTCVSRPCCGPRGAAGGAGGCGGRRRRQHRGEARREILLAHLTGLVRVEFVEPHIRQGAQLVAAELAVAVGIAGAQHLGSEGPPRAAAPGRRRGRSRTAGLFMIGIAGGVNPRQSLAGPDEFEQRLLAGGRYGGIVGVVQERSGGVVEE